MGQYADQIANLELVQQLKKSAGRDDISQTDIDKLDAMIKDVADTVGPLLKLIPQTFKQYTEHDIGHSRNILYLMGKFIPKQTLERLNGLELAMLVLSALLHDLGMYVTDKEKHDTLRSAAYRDFLAHHQDRVAAMEAARKNGDDYQAALIQDALLAEYFRRLHPERAAIHVANLLTGKLKFQDKDITPYVLKIGESHGWGVLESNDLRNLDKAVCRLDTRRLIYGVPVNEQYLACCLRLGDIMDFDRSRTPIAVFQNIAFTESKSWDEWNKHLQVSGWSISEHEVVYATECNHPAFYVAVMEFLDWIDAELRECRHLLVRIAPHGIPERYRLHLPPVVDRWKVEMEDKRYLAGAFRFHLEYERIMQLLMDKSLYPDPSLFLRELLQNALDACRNLEALAKSAKPPYKYKPRIAVWDYSDDPHDPRIIFQDNGIGMSRRIVENYFMRVGRSYYRSAEFEAERRRLREAGVELEATSQFGIGVLSCFMVADRFEVETYRTGNQPLHITIEGPTKYFTIRLLDEPPRAVVPTQPASDKHDGPPHYPGTRITVHLRPDANVDAYQVLDKFAVNVEYDLFVYRSGAKKPRKISRLRWESKDIRFRDVSAGMKIQRTFVSPRSYREGYSPVAKNLEEILTVSRIPFERYDFSRHLRGTAWFWLLQGEDGKACPRRGYLRISGIIRCMGLPALISELTSTVQSRSDFVDWKNFLEALQRDVVAHVDLSEDSETYQKFVTCYQKVPRFRIYSEQPERFISAWNQLQIDERHSAYASLEAFTENATVWCEVSEVVKELLIGTSGWAKRGIDFSHYIEIKASPQSVALHGVLLPAGFVLWNPMEGNARKLDLLEWPGGVRIDARGSSAPTPSASRLFVDIQEAPKTIIPFARAALRHAVELVAQHPENPDWLHWLNTFLKGQTDLAFWWEAVRQEFEVLEPYLNNAIRSRIGYETRS